MFHSVNNVTNSMVMMMSESKKTVSLEKRLSEEAEWMYDWNNKGMDAIPLETIKEELRVSAEKIRSIFNGSPKSEFDKMLSHYDYEAWIEETKKKILKELVEPSSVSEAMNIRGLKCPYCLKRLEYIEGDYYCRDCDDSYSGEEDVFQKKEDEQK